MRFQKWFHTDPYKYVNLCLSENQQKGMKYIRSQCLWKRVEQPFYPSSMLFVRKKSDTDIPASQRSNSHPESSSATPPYALPNHCHSTDGESVYSKRNSASSSRRTSMLLHLKSVLQWKDNGIWSPPPSPRSTLLFVPLPQPSHSRNGKVKPLPPLPIVDGGDQDRKCRAQKSFRNVHGRLFSKNTGKFTIYFRDRSTKSGRVSDQ